MTALDIKTNTRVPDVTYYRVGHVEPDLEGTTLTILTGEGDRRNSWRWPQKPTITSTVMLNEDDLVSIHVHYWTKHSYGDIWRHYQPIDGEWKQVTWGKLHDRDRLRILIQHEERINPYRPAPGDLRENYKVPTRNTQTSYKLVEVTEDGIYRSIFDSTTTYSLNKWRQQKAIEKHGGGYYSYPDKEEMLALFDKKELFHPDYYKREMMLAVLQCEIGDTLIPYEKKIASTYIRPVKELDRFMYAPEPVLQS